MIKYSNKKVIEVRDWDKLVQETYRKPYSFQQQDGCQARGTVNINISSEDDDEEMYDLIPEIINGDVMGVKFNVWLKRDPKEWNGEKEEEWFIDLFWERNFYPDLQTVANDLHKKGLIEAGEYSINIDW
jgi:hypothetical protein